MPLKPPTYGSREYWDQRFAKDSNPFDWLSAPDALDPFITDALQDTTNPEPEILHIGCGSSLLSYHLRAHVKTPKQVHNVDYSEIAVNIGKQREVDLLTHEHGIAGEADGSDECKEKPPAKKASSNITSERLDFGNAAVFSNDNTDAFMRWDSTDLLDLKRLLDVCKPNTYSVIIDKSTSDSIACADDMEIPLPYPLSCGPQTRREYVPGQTSSAYPVQLMAVHLALVTEPGARWISLSYSAERYYFLDAASSYSSVSAEQEQDSDSALPNVRLLWRVLGKYELEAPEMQVPGREQNSASVAHLPKVYHWVHVLERTETPVAMRSEHM
jgi:hypothetical protein